MRIVAFRGQLVQTGETEVAVDDALAVLRIVVAVVLFNELEGAKLEEPMVAETELELEPRLLT